MFTRKLPLLKRTHSFSPQLRKFETQFKNNLEFITQYFNLPDSRALDYIREERLSRIPLESLVQVVHFCKSIGFSNSAILKHPILLRCQLSTIDQYYTTMKEGGFENITAERLSKFRSLYRLTISTLKEFNHIRQETDVAASFVSHLNPCPEDFNVSVREASNSWSDVHFKVLSKYLIWRLGCGQEDVNHLVQTHVTVSRKSFTYLCENIAIAEDLGFTPDKILRNGYILRGYPKYTRELLEKCPEIAGVSMRKAIKMYPKLMSTNASNVQSIYDTLKKHNISDEAIARRMNVFYLAPETVEERLQELERDEELKVLLQNPNFLKLVVHHNRAKTRLDLLRELRIKCASTSILGNDKTRFDVQIKEGKDMNRWSDVYPLFKEMFNEKVEDCEAIFKRHPYYLQVPLTSIKATYRYLEEKRFTDSSIIECAYLLLYSKEKIESALSQVDQHEANIGAHFDQVKRLNLVLYFIEKEHHFTGDGVWTKTEAPYEENLE